MSLKLYRVKFQDTQGYTEKPCFRKLRERRERRGEGGREREKEYFEDIAEQYVLWSIECQLEKELVEPHTDNYSELIKQARNTVRKNY